MSIAVSRVVDEVFPRRDIGIYCPVCKKECIFEWVVFRKGERSISQRCLVHGHLRLAPMVSAFIGVKYDSNITVYLERLSFEFSLEYSGFKQSQKAKVVYEESGWCLGENEIFGTLTSSEIRYMPTMINTFPELSSRQYNISNS